MMRDEAQMLELILQTAQNDERIRVVVMNGSRVNPAAKSDIFADFDIVYLVSELGSFKADPSWIDRFGQRMVMQLPDEFGDARPQGHYTYLMQFMDGNRLDLTLLALSEANLLLQDSLSHVLLDKDGLLELPPPSEASYLPKPPTAKQFFERCNELWWVAPYVAKGLWRGEVIYAQHHLEILRNQLLRMLEWNFGIRTQFGQNPGKSGKRLRGHLSDQQWQLLMQTYAQADLDKLWLSLLALTELFREVALEVAANFGFEYPKQDDSRVSAHLKQVQALPKDSKQMY